MTSAVGDAGLFVVVSTQRSGSNWLEDRLDSHPQITMIRNEPFRRTVRAEHGYPAFSRADPVARRIRFVLPPVAKSRFLNAQVGSRQTPVVGLRVMYDQLRRSPSLGPLLVRHRARFVHLVRANVLATYVSVLTAKRSGVFVSERDGVESRPVEVPVEGLRAELHRRRRRLEVARTWLARHDALEVEYERYVTDPPGLDARVARFVGVDPDLPMSSRYARLGHERTGDAIANVAAVAAELRGTAYEWML